jgi:hypothetical protein
MTTTLSTLSTLPSTKKQGEAFATMLKSEIAVSKNTLQVLVQLKIIEKVFKDVLTNDDLDALYLKEFNESAKDNKLIVNEATLTSQEFGVKYDYESCNDEKWNNLNIIIKDATERKKFREEQLKSNAIKSGGKSKVVCKL